MKKNLEFSFKIQAKIDNFRNLEKAKIIFNFIMIDLIKYPVITEKAYRLIASNQYTFGATRF